MNEGGEKKFDLSERRRGQLRQEGMVPRSQDISTTVILGVGLALLVWFGGTTIGYLRELMRRSFLEVGQSNLSLRPETVGALFTSDLWLSLGLFVVAIAAAVFISQAAQVGLSVGDEALSLKFERLNPASNFQNLFSLNKLTQSGQSLLKLSIIGLFSWVALRQIQDSPVFIRPVNLRELGETYTNVSWSLGWHIVLVLALLATADLVWQRWKFNRDNRMTFEQVKEERRSQEMSPEVMKKRRLMGRKYSMRKQLENMKDATVVVVNPTHYAVALKYRKGETDAPIVVAKGIRGNARRIKERAYDLRLLVRRDVPLARGLYKYGKIDQPIPPIFYQAVAAILALLYRRGFRDSEGFETRPATPAGPTDDPEIWNTEND